MQKIILKQKNKCQVLDVDEIVFCKSHNNYTEIFCLKQKNLTSTECLKKFTEKLNGDFIRVSQSVLVNLHYIQEIIPQKKEIILSTGDKTNFTMKYSELVSLLKSTFSEGTKPV
ncbi:MAG: LytTR family transcriptional regulator [Prolixibacteraceae bacterium]|nr:LytTR family transcriptional regulator [Prolixibacteraceae bacterium]